VKYLTNILMFILLLLLLVSPLYAQTALKWEVNPDADYYKMYMRSPGEVDFKELGQTSKTEFLLPTTLDKKKTYEFTLKAFNIYGNSSGFSDTLSWNEGSNTFPRKCVGLKAVLIITIPLDDADLQR